MIGFAFITSGARTLFADSDGLFIELDKDRFGSLVDLAAEMLRNASGQ